MAVDEQRFLVGETISVIEDLIADNSTTRLERYSLALTKWKNIPFKTRVASPQNTQLQTLASTTNDSKC
jgi:hypothetical protein